MGTCSSWVPRTLTPQQVWSSDPQGTSEGPFAGKAGSTGVRRRLCRLRDDSTTAARATQLRASRRRSAGQANVRSNDVDTMVSGRSMSRTPRQSTEQYRTDRTSTRRRHTREFLTTLHTDKLPWTHLYSRHLCRRGDHSPRRLHHPNRTRRSWQRRTGGRIQRRENSQPNRRLARSDPRKSPGRPRLDNLSRERPSRCRDTPRGSILCSHLRRTRPN